MAGRPGSLGLGIERDGREQIGAVLRCPAVRCDVDVIDVLELILELVFCSLMLLEDVVGDR